MINKMGGRITGAGTSTIQITGVKELHGTTIETIPDRIEAGTYMMIGALCGENLKINGIVPVHLKSLLDKFDEIGIKYHLDSTSIVLSKSDNLKAIDVRTDVYPDFPTDLGQPMAVILTQCNGTSNFEETIYESRTGHYPELNKMGANIKYSGMKAKIKGRTPLIGKEVTATDLRAGAALTIAGLIAEGTTKISNIEYILRGYEDIVEKLSNVGANIKIIED